MTYVAHVNAYKNYRKNRVRADARRVDAAHATADDVLLTEHEVAGRQGRSVRTLQNQRVNGGGIPYLKLGRAVRYRLSDVITWEEARRFSSTSEKEQRKA